MRAVPVPLSWSWRRIVVGVLMVISAEAALAVTGIALAAEAAAG